jgi:hypothetical protein
MAAAEEKSVQKQLFCPTCYFYKDPSEYSKRAALCKPCTAMWASIYRLAKKHDHMHFYQDARYRHARRGHEVWLYVQMLKQDLDQGERRKTPMFMIDEFYQACGWEEPPRHLNPEDGRAEPLPQPQLQQVPEPESQPSSNSSSSRADTPELSSQAQPSSSMACTQDHQPEKKRKTKSEMDTIEVDAIGDEE